MLSLIILKTLMLLLCNLSPRCASRLLLSIGNQDNIDAHSIEKVSSLEIVLGVECACADGHYPNFFLTDMR